MNTENALHNEEKGLKYLEKAADQHNSIVALSELGNYYFRLSDEASGEEKSKSAKKSLQYFERASKLGDNQATYWIGKLDVQADRSADSPRRLRLSPRGRYSDQY
jgi:TPR repeat protein